MAFVVQWLKGQVVLDRSEPFDDKAEAIDAAKDGLPSFRKTFDATAV